MHTVFYYSSVIDKYSRSEANWRVFSNIKRTSLILKVFLPSSKVRVFSINFKLLVKIFEISEIFLITSK